MYSDKHYACGRILFARNNGWSDFKCKPARWKWTEHTCSLAGPHNTIATAYNGRIAHSAHLQPVGSEVAVTNREISSKEFGDMYPFENILPHTQKSLFKYVAWVCASITYTSPLSSPNPLPASFKMSPWTSTQSTVQAAQWQCACGDLLYLLQCFQFPVLWKQIWNPQLCQSVYERHKRYSYPLQLCGEER